MKYTLPSNQYAEDQKVLENFAKNCWCFKQSSIELQKYMYFFWDIFAESFNLTNLGDLKWDELFSIPKYYWLDDIRESKRFLEDQVGTDVPQVIWDELDEQEKRLRDLL